MRFKRREPGVVLSLFAGASVPSFLHCDPGVETDKLVALVFCHPSLCHGFLWYL